MYLLPVVLVLRRKLAKKGMFMMSWSAKQEYEQQARKNKHVLKILNTYARNNSYTTISFTVTDECRQFCWH